jgi:conjugative transposon protein TcpC
MVRRAILDRGAQPTAHAAGVEAAPGAPESAEETAERAAPHWRGSGGRWLVWASRAVLWAALLIIGYRGVTAIVTPQKQAAPAAAAPAAGTAHGFPVSLAEAYALQFGQVYLNFSPSTAGQRAKQLAAFLPAGSDAQLGWNGAGALRLQSEEVAGISVQDSRQAVVTLLVRAGGQLMELGVPVYAANGGLSVSAEPSLLPAPPRTVPPTAQSGPSDPSTAAALGRQLPAFFQAYASGDPVTLSRFLASGASITGLGGIVTYDAISGIQVPPGGSTRQITVSVIWHLAGQAGTAPKSAGTSSVTTAPAGLEVTYQMTVVQQGGSWYIASIGTSPLPVAAP